MDARGGLGEAIDLAASLTGCEKNETPWRRVRYNSEMPGELATLVETAPTVVEAEIPVGSVYRSAVRRQDYSPCREEQKPGRPCALLDSRSHQRIAARFEGRRNQ